MEITLKMHGTSQRTGHLPVKNTGKYFAQNIQKQGNAYEVHLHHRYTQSCLGSFDDNSERFMR